MPVTAQVKITNTGAAPEDYFLDPRLVKTTTVELESETGATFPLPVEGLVPEWLVPTQTSSVRVAAKATVPIEFDYGPIQGDPDLVSTAGSGNRAAGSYTPPGGTVGPGNWFAAPDEFGPYPDGAPGGKVEMTMTATTRAFDRSVTTETGDLWLASQNPLALFSPFTIAPGQSAVITVRIKPEGPSGTVVRGDLFVDDYVPPCRPTARPPATNWSRSPTPTRSSSHAARARHCHGADRSSAGRVAGAWWGLSHQPRVGPASSSPRRPEHRQSHQPRVGPA